MTGTGMTGTGMTGTGMTGTSSPWHLQLRLRLTLTLAALALLPFAASAFFIWRSAEQHVRDSERVHLRSDLVLAQSELANRLDLAEIHSQQAATSPVLHQALYQHAHGDRREAERALRRIASAGRVSIQVGRHVVAGHSPALAALSRKTVVADADGVLGVVVAGAGTPRQLRHELESAAALERGEWFSWERGWVSGRPISAGVLRFQAAPRLVLAIHESRPALAAAVGLERLKIAGAAAAAVVLLLALAFLLARPLLARISEMQRAAQESLTDELTGLANRRSIRRVMRAELDRAHRHEAALSVILCDLDDFKQVNDLYGHEAGDRVLEAFARMMQTELRSHDHAGRYGGEEFVIVLPETDTCSAVRAGERLRAAFAQTRVAGIRHPLSASFGVASFPEQADADSLLREADRALYEAKASGKGCVRSAAGPRPARTAAAIAS